MRVSRRTSIGLLYNCLIVCLSFSGMAEAAETPASTKPVVYEDAVLPLFQKHCVKCHSQKNRKAEFDLSSIAGLLQGGESGAGLVAGKPDESLLYDYLHEGLMPPEDETPLSKTEIETVRLWISGGLKFKEVPQTVADNRLSQHDVIPILYRRCVMCHGPEYQEGELDLRSKAKMLTGGKAGPAVIAGKPDESLLVKYIVEKTCPPKAEISRAGIEPMPAEELDTVKAWIADGLHVEEETERFRLDQDPLVTTEDRQFWSFQPPQQVAPPTVKHQSLVKNPIDAFLLRKLEAADLTYAPEADRRTLIRRATYALTGLPPTQAEVNAFLSDKSPDAYEKLIDRLLASPRYAEKWGQFWLDLAGYADSEGKRSADLIRKYAYRYRDYVIRSFGEDKPYDVFLTEQLAGDELVDHQNPKEVTPELIEKVVATGFLRMAPDGTSANPVNRVTDRLEVISDELDVMYRSVLGLTMNCARCHSHKYDPIPQRDYYRSMAIFKGAYDEYDWMTPQPFSNQWKRARSRLLTLIPKDEQAAIDQHNAPIEAKITDVEQKLKDKKLDKAEKKKLDKQLKDLKATLKNPEMIRALWDRGRPSPTYIYRRGDEMQPTRPVEPGPPSAIAEGISPYRIDPSTQNESKTGRRLAFARWLTQPDHPLTSRVIVNRIWHKHFGTGLVKSIDNFGALGTPPSHPELLDWLAVQFVQEGWQFKKLHRLIMTSQAYRQSSEVTPLLEEKDPENELLSRMPLRRLEAEELRDALLFTAGELDETKYGQPVAVDVRKDGLVTAKRTDDGWRRSVYIRHRRKEMPTFLEVFDLPQMNPNCTERKISNVVSQPLLLVNNNMVHELAVYFANRVRQEAGDDRAAQIKAAYRIAFQRPPSTEELELALKSLNLLNLPAETDSGKESDAADGFAEYCHVLLNSAEFLYID
ncbi:Planctomycete cytochrome C [Gimesia panareensis]|uniref:Planctomycete cytochrome C n=1 Tax=Gimesia panareensis TaxID=2527978 RepID=A0A517QDB0_9PLAN|nr:PSD1 and planctomycete cytochrome C domain-containing protein [Gimesia panareensis]QDT29623.1 Planctomycete cytochrome C [Gimesia panareensis]